MGFTWGDVVDYMTGLLKLVIGSGLGLLQTLLPYIIALVIIGAIVYFLYRAFQFFRH
jgi:thiamine transporter ThiT